MHKLIQKLRDYNQISNNLPLHLHIEDDGGGFLINSVDEPFDDFGTLDELNKTLDTLINEVAILQRGID